MSLPPQPQHQHRFGLTKRLRALIYSLVSLVALLVVAFVLPVPFVKLAPGPTFNVIGEHDGTPVLVIDGTQTHPVTGELLMTTILESGGPRGGLTFLDALTSWLDASDAVLPQELLYPDGTNTADLKSRQAAMFSMAESDAIGAAMNYLQRPVSTEVVVTSVLSGSPSQGVLEPGDHVRSVDGTAIDDAAQVRELIHAKPVGTTFAFAIDRVVDGQRTPMSVEVTSAANPDDASAPYIGISVGLRYEPDFSIDFTLQDIGGPSAGLMFTLGLIDKLSPDDLAAGHIVAGTGTIDPDGTVGPIGGIRQKLAGARKAGAELFLLPAQHCKEIAGHIPDGLTVTPVATVTDAVSALATWTTGGAPKACPA